MLFNFFYKLRHRPVSYLFPIFFAALAVIAGVMSLGEGRLSAFQKLVLWPISWEFFIEMLTAAQCSWLAVSDFAGGTYINIIAAGAGRTKYFFSKLFAILLTVTVELFAAATVFLIINFLGEEHAVLTGTQTGMVTLNLLLMWARHMMLAAVCVAVCFIVRRLYSMFVCIAVTFVYIFLDSASSVTETLSWYKIIMRYLPLGTAKAMRDSLLIGSFSAKESVVATIPVIVIALVAVAVTALIFNRADLD